MTFLKSIHITPQIAIQIIRNYDITNIKEKWLEHEVNHSLPFSVEVKNVWSFTSTPPHIFMV
jgi:hypothetical protein